MKLKNLEPNCSGNATYENISGYSIRNSYRKIDCLKFIYHKRTDIENE